MFLFLHELVASNLCYSLLQGDSGGPMVVQREDQGYILSGIVSWGKCGNFTAFARVSEFRDWISQYVQF